MSYELIYSFHIDNKRPEKGLVELTVALSSITLHCRSAHTSAQNTPVTQNQHNWPTLQSKFCNEKKIKPQVLITQDNKSHYEIFTYIVESQ